MRWEVCKMTNTPVQQRLEAGATLTGGLGGRISATVSLGDPPSHNPPWHGRIMEAADWMRLLEWGWDKVQTILDWIAGAGLFRQR